MMTDIWMNWYIIYHLRCSTAWTSSPPSSSTSSLLSTSISSGAPNHLFTRSFIFIFISSGAPNHLFACSFIFIFSLSLYLLVHPTIRLPAYLPPKNCSSSVGDWSLAKPSRRRTLLVFMRAFYFLCFSTRSGRCSAPPAPLLCQVVYLVITEGLLHKAMEEDSSLVTSMRWIL